MIRQLPIVQIGNKKYFLDERLKEYRQVDNPHNRISFDEIGDKKVSLVQKRQQKLKRGKGL